MCIEPTNVLQTASIVKHSLSHYLPILLSSSTILCTNDLNSAADNSFDKLIERTFFPLNLFLYILKKPIPCRQISAHSGRAHSYRYNANNIIRKLTQSKVFFRPLLLQHSSIWLSALFFHLCIRKYTNRLGEKLSIGRYLYLHST